MTSRLTEQERLAVVETKIDTVLQQQESISKKLDVLLPTFATKLELEEAKKDHDKQIAEVKRKHTYQIWLVGTLSALFGGVMTLLLAFFFNNVGRL